MKKLFVVLLVVIFAFSAVACDKGKPIETAEDLFGVWKVTQPLPDYFTEEYCEELGLTDFKTSAVYEWHIELHNDGTTTYLIDYEFLISSREKKAIIRFFTNYSAKLKKYYPKMSLQVLLKKVTDTKITKNCLMKTQLMSISIPNIMRIIKSF